MNKSTLFPIVIIAHALALFSSSAWAGFTTYSDAAAWNSAVGFSVTEPFNASSLQPFTGVSTIAGSRGPTSGLLPGSVWRDSMYNNSVNQSGTTFSYNAGQLYGVGALWDTSVNGEGLGIDISWNGGSAHIGPIDGGFFGWTSTTPFNSFSLSIYFVSSGGGETFNMDNLQFAPIPEPASATMMVLGILALCVRKRVSH